MNDKKFIPEIYVYCDRWCEHCPFTDRCEVFDPTEKDTDFSRADANEFLQEIKATFEKTMNLLKNEADASGINWNQLVADAKEVELEDPILPKGHQEVVALAGDYRCQVSNWLSECSKDIEDITLAHAENLEMGIKDAKRNNYQFIAALENINWYHALIEAKIRRAINGLNSDFEEDQADSTQSHANGCAKITMLFINKSIKAWEEIKFEMVDKEDEILDHLAALSRLEGKIRIIFPAFESFNRPGFDTLNI